MDPVLAAARPAFDAAGVVEIARQTFGVDAADAKDLGSERDQTFLLLDRDAAPLAVMKVSNAAEDPTILDMEALGVLHAGRVDPSIPLAAPWAVPGARPDSGDPADRRAAFTASDGTHHVRLYDVLSGRGRVDARELSDAMLGDWGEMAARVGRALRGFFHPAAHRTMLWDVQHAARTRELLDAIRVPSQRGLVERALDRFDAIVSPVWPSLRAQVVHGDLTTDNALVDGEGRITGIVDFGDMSHTALVTDIASLLDSLLNGREGDELFRAGRLALDGYQRSRSRSRRSARNEASRTRPSPSATTRVARGRSGRSSTSVGTRPPGGSAVRPWRGARARPLGWRPSARRSSVRRWSR
jgi:Ser/Thr protein kinase RdoA (MazF antagonist)